MQENWRIFAWIAAVGGVLGVLGWPYGVWAQRVRILGGAPSGEATPISAGRPSPDLQRFLGAIQVGEVQAQGALRVFWLHGAPGDALPGAALPIATLEEARASGALVITERDQASVPEVIVENRGKAHVLLLAGEILLGGKQNRVLSVDLLLPPQSGPRNIAVYCVEQGRWAGSSKGFQARGSFAAPGLRSKVLERAPQPSIWAEVEHYSRRAAASSPTRSYQAIYEQGEVQRHLAEVERKVDSRNASGALGAAVFVGERLVGIDLFFGRELFGREWPKLLRAQALEAFGLGEPAHVDDRRMRARVEEVLRAAASAEGTPQESPGVGELFAFRLPAHRGAALLFEGRVIHLAVL
jgi:hypothetical protein